MKRVKYNQKYRSEELKEITLKENINNYSKTVIFIIAVLILIVTLGFFIKYPEKITGQIFVVSYEQENKIFSPINGKIQFHVNENSSVEKGQLLAIIDNPADYKDLILLKKNLADFNFGNISESIENFQQEDHLKLGDIENQYYNFLLAIVEYQSFSKINIYKQRIENIHKRIKRNQEKLEMSRISEKIVNEKSDILNKMYATDSTLFIMDAIVKEDIDNSKIDVLNLREKNIFIRKTHQELTHLNEQLIDEISLLKKESEKQVLAIIFNVKKSYYELKTAIDFWERNFIIRSPKTGKIEFYQKFLNSNEYITKDIPLFVLLPKVDSIFVKGIMSAHGYGSMSIEDTVFIKLNDYPYKEYGGLKGTIYNKSKVYHDSIYYIDVRLVNGLLTSQNKTLDFSYNMSGKLEYYTRKRNVIQRIFSEIHNSVYD